MPDPTPKFYLTTPIYYVNARPHIGHAYSTIAADVIARRHRLLGDDTFFLTGTDEHGQKVQRSAAAAGIPPQQFADEVSATFSSLWKRMGITNDDFIRTTDGRHKRGVQKLWRDLEARGAIYLSTYTGQYSVGEEMFVEGPPGTLGPDGKPTETVTEENYFFRLSDYQLPLIDLIESGQLHIQPEAIKNEVLSFVRGPVSSVQLAAEPVLLSEAQSTQPNPDIVILSGGASAPQSKDLRLSALGNPYVPGALKDLSISRTTFDWGIPVPGNEKHVVYVWLDALANYMTAVGYGSDDPADIAKFERYWPADLHLVGKEITRFHCVYWPAFLMAAGLPLPKAVVANGWLLFEESKMSKSRGNVVRTETILDAFGPLCPAPSAAVHSANEDGPQRLKPVSEGNVDGTAEAVPLSKTSDAQQATKAQQDLFAADVLRYFLLREIPFGQDGSFSFDALITRYNADLANGYGNLVSRTLKMIEQNQSGHAFPNDCLSWGEHDWLDYAFAKSPGGFQSSDSTKAPPNSEDFSYDTQYHVIEHAIRTRDLFADKFGKIGFLALLAEANLTISITDKFLSREAPWKLAKDVSEESRNKLSEILYTAAESIRIITALLYPVLPYATASVWRQLGLREIEDAAAKGELKNLQWGGLKPGTKLGVLAPIFPRADKGLAQTMNDMEAANTKPATPEAAQSVEVTTAPDAGPRTAALAEENPAAKVAGSHALTTERELPPASQPATGNPQPTTPTIAIDDFVKIDLRVAQIVVAERIPKADKLLRLEVDLGYERRQILSGIAEWYTPEELIGRRIAIIANLAPRKMRGLESHGMLLAASDGEAGKPVLATFSEEIALGSKIR